MIGSQSRSSWSTLIIACALSATTAKAAPTAYTERAAFLAAAGGAGVELRLPAAPGTTIADGQVVGANQYSFDLGGVALAVAASRDMGVGPVVLGVDDPPDHLFVGGDAITWNFSNASAFGFYVILGPGEAIAPGDFRLTIANLSLTTAMTPDLVLADGGAAYFLGIVDPDGFSSASLESDAANLGADTLFTVPEPNLPWLAIAALGLAAGWRSRHTRRRS